MHAAVIPLLQVVDSNMYGVKGWLCRNEHAGAFVGEQGQRWLRGDTNIVVVRVRQWYERGRWVVHVTQYGGRMVFTFLLSLGCSAFNLSHLFTPSLTASRHVKPDHSLAS